jgi:hypothetical protein
MMPTAFICRRITPETQDVMTTAMNLSDVGNFKAISYPTEQLRTLKNFIPWN